MKKLCLTAAAAALLVLTACGAKKTAPVVTEMHTVFYGADGSQLATQRTVNTYDEKGLALRTEIEQDGTLLMRLNPPITRTACSPAASSMTAGAM